MSTIVINKMNKLLIQMQRKKTNDYYNNNCNNKDNDKTQLKRCLTTIDIILFGLGHMIGSGVYVLTSSIIKNITGPAIIISYLIAGFVAFLCALCYAEFASRYPKCGSAYSYAYIALGEIWAFIVGWNMILENVIGIAAVSRASSAYLDSIISGEIRNYTNTLLIQTINIDNDGGTKTILKNFDLLSGLIIIIFTIFLTYGMNITTIINNIFSLINIIVIIIIIIFGLFHLNFDNWFNNDDDGGGFMPYGWKGVFAGSASCFYAYIGFDSIATSGDEANDPQQSIPLATFISMIIASISYIGVSLVLTLMISYKKLSDESGLPDTLGLYDKTNTIKIIVIVGACCGMATVLIGTIYSLTRIVYAMSNDGLLFPWMSIINTKTQIPLRAMYFFTFFAFLMAIFMDITTLIEMMSIGSLIAYLVVSASVIVVRYRKINPNHHSNEKIINQQIKESNLNNQDDNEDQQQQGESSIQMNNEQEKLLNTNDDENIDDDDDDSNQINYKKLLLKYLNIKNNNTNDDDRLISYCVLLIVILSLLFCLTCKLFKDNIKDNFLIILILIIITIILIGLISIINLNQQHDEQLRYKVPFVPFIPILSIIFNVILIVNLNLLTWIRFIIWMIIGLSIYLIYGIKSSKAEYNDELCEKINNNNNNIKKWNSMESTISQNEDILMSRE